MLFMVEELMQQNFYTILKKMNLAVMLISALYIQQFNITKNMQLVTPQKYSIMKNVMKNGLV